MKTYHGRVPVPPTRLFLSLPVLLMFSPAALAQTFSLGADVMSRYIWRGTDFGESVSIQPALTFTQGGVSVGSWASYGVSPEAASVNEHDLWVSYSVQTRTGTWTVGATDYYFPNAGYPFFDFDGEGEGAHWIEPFASFTGPVAFPIGLYAGVFVHNDPDRSVYLQASYPFTTEGVALTFTAAASAGPSALYGTDTFGITTVGLTALKSVPITDRFALPVTVSYLVNPYQERSFLVFGLRF
jgi:hypothetical protein